MSDASAPPAERTIAGVRLDKYAAVHAAVGDGFPLQTVLRHEGIAVEAWDAIETAWAKALLESAKGEGHLVVAYDEQLLAAKDRLWRPLPPIDQDVRKWFDFVRHWAAAEDKMAFLAEQRLNIGDFTRLHRSWSRKLEADEALRRDAFGALCAEPGPLPVVEPGPAVLPPPRDTPARALPPPPPPVAVPLAAASESALPSLAVALPPAPADAPPPAPRLTPRPSAAPPRRVATPSPRSYVPESVAPAPSAAAARLTLATYASLCAELEVFPDAADRAYGKYGLNTPLAREAERASWEAHLGANPEARAEWKEHYEQFLNHWSTMKRSMRGK